MKKISSLLIAFTIFSLSLSAQSKAQKAVSAAVENLRQAMVSGDRTALSNIAAEDLSYGHSSGKVENKAQFVEAIASGRSNFEKIDLTEQTIKVVGKTAIVRHNLFAETNNVGSAPGTVKLSILTIWQKQSGQWKLLARQAVKLP
jgi:ketosteroid isomerase-like protein